MPAVDDLLAAARARLERVEPADLDDERAAGALVVDIRPIEQRERDGELPGAIVIPRNGLEWRLDATSANRTPAADADRRVIVVCGAGYASSLAAAALQDLRVARATDRVGSYRAWLSLQA